jgi:hypothetical protein
MLRDAQLAFSDSQAPTAVATTASTNIIDTLNPAPADAGIGEEMWLVVQVMTTATSGGAATLAVVLQTDDNSSFSSAATLYTSSTYALASLTAGTFLVRIRLPQACERYLRVGYTIGTAVLTAGAFSAYLTRNVDLVGTTPIPRATYAVA